MKRIALSFLILFGVLYGLFQLSRARTFQLFGELVPRVETTRKVVALTFDDGPVASSAEEILAALGDVKATFFVCGAEIESHPAVLPRLVAAGHQIGNHTYHHDRLVLKRPSYIASEVESTDALIRGAGWSRPILFRAPYCKKLVALPWYLSRTGRTHVTWDVEPESDSRIDRNADRIVSDVVEKTRPGSIILLHPWYSGREATRAAIPRVIAELRGRGYDFVTLDSLLEMRK